MPAEELAQILDFCQPGTVIDPNVAREGTVGACKIYEFVTDSGQNLGTVCEETVDLGNGTLATLRNFCTVSASTGIATLTGLAAIPVTITTAVQIMTAFLGISGGVALYSAFPDFFTQVSDAIFGDAVDHIPVIFVDSHGNIRIAENTANKVKEIALTENVYAKTEIRTTQAAAVSLQQYLQGLVNRSFTFASNDNPTVSEIFEWLENYDQIYTFTPGTGDYAGKELFIKTAFHKLFDLDSDLSGAGERRRRLLSWLNKYYDPQTNFLLVKGYYESVSDTSRYPTSPYFFTFESYSKDYYNDFLNNVPMIFYDGTTFVTKNPQDLRFIRTDSSARQFLFPTTGTTLIAMGLYENGLKSFSKDDTNRLMITRLPFKYMTHMFYLYDSPGHGLDSGYEWNYQWFNPDTGEYMPATDNDPDFYDSPLGAARAFNYLHSTIIPRYFQSYIMYGYPRSEGYGMMSTAGIKAIIDNEPYTWVYPDTVVPEQGVPVTETYPNLNIINDPSIGNLIGITPPELMPNPSQEAAQESDPDSNPGGYADFITDNISNVNPVPEPSPDPSPDPTPSPEPSPEPSPSPSPDPSPDPGNPNVNPQPDPTPVIDPTLQSIDSSRLFTVYWLSANELDQLGAYLWSTNFITAVEKIWQDPMQAIISLKKVYAQPLSVSRQNIILGFLDSGVSARVVSSQFVSKSYGTISVKEIMHNATDYSPYSQAMIYLPFIGIEQIDIDDIMGGDLTVRYTFDLYTGICIAELFVLRDDLTPQKMLYTFTGNVAQDVPLTSASFQGFFSTLMSIASTPLLVGSGGGILAASHLAHSMNHELVHISHSGNLSANAGIMGNRYPQLILTNRNRYDAAAYNTIYGYPANKTVYLGNCSGYTKVKAIQLQTFATQDEKDEIEQLLKEGVIF